MTDIRVNAGMNLQSAIDQAMPGDRIIVESGATFTGPFSLPKKSGDAFVEIVSSKGADLPPGRITPDKAGMLPKLVSPGANQSVITTRAAAHHYKLSGLEIQPASATVIVSDLIRFGDGSSAQNTLESVPHHLVLDRCYIHGFPTMELKRGVALNSASTDIQNCYISEVHMDGNGDTQAICGWNGPGPFRIVDSYLEAAGENVMFGGADTSIPNLIPSDIEITRCHFFKPLTWKPTDPSFAGKHWSVKNLLETKNARRLKVTGNVFENCWADAQVGFAILVKSNNQDETNPWAVTEDLEFTNNIIKNAENGLNILGIENPPKVSATASRLKFVNNLWLVNNIWFQGLRGAKDVLLDHNTFLTQTGNIMTFDDLPLQGLVATNNLGKRTGFGIKGSGTSEGVATLDAFAPGYNFKRNVIAGADPRVYPSDNFYPAWTEVQLGADFRLSPTSPFKGKGTDGKDVGADIDQILAAQRPAAEAPKPGPTTTPVPGNGTKYSYSSVAEAQNDSEMLKLLNEKGSEGSKYAFAWNGRVYFEKVS